MLWHRLRPRACRSRPVTRRITTVLSAGSTKPAEQLIEVAEGTRLRRAIGALDLTALGIGAIIGTGLFVIVGEAIGQSGPALVISFVVAGVTCIFSALSYAELAPPCRSPARRIRTRTQRWASCSPGSSAGI